MDIAGNRIQNAAIRGVQTQTLGEWRIASPIRKSRQLLRVVANSKAPAQDQFFLEVMPQHGSGTPGKADLRSKIFLGGGGQVASLFDGQPGQCSRACADYGIADQSVQLTQRRIIFPAKTEVDREVRLHLPIILNIERHDIEPQIFAIIRRLPRQWIEVAGLLIGRVIGIVPQIAEAVAGPRRSSVIVKKFRPGEVSAEFERVAAAYLGKCVAHVPGPLIEYARTRKTPTRKAHLTVGVDIAGWQAPRQRIRRELVIIPAACAEASLIQHAGGDGMVPNPGPGLGEAGARSIAHIARAGGY